MLVSLVAIILLQCTYLQFCNSFAARVPKLLALAPSHHLRSGASQRIAYSGNPAIYPALSRYLSCPPDRSRRAANMHRCLELLDIFYNILEFACVEIWDDNDPYQGHHACYSSNPILAALARTCRTFLEPTLDIMWRNQLTLAPLIGTLPADAIHERIECPFSSLQYHYLVSTHRQIQSDPMFICNHPLLFFH